MSENDGILWDSDLVEDLDNQAAEAIDGGRMSAGIIRKDGFVWTGTDDFRVVREEAPGVYLIDFEPNYQKMYGGAGTQIFYNNGKGGDTTDNVVFIDFRREHLRLKTGDGDGNAQDRDFSFIVYGI